MEIDGCLLWEKLKQSRSVSFVLSVVPDKATVFVMSHPSHSGFVRRNEEPSGDNQPRIKETRVILVHDAFTLFVLDSELITTEPLHDTVDLDYINHRFMAVVGEESFLAALCQGV
jgi:hypothetical protein